MSEATLDISEELIEEPTDIEKVDLNARWTKIGAVATSAGLSLAISMNFQPVEYHYAEGLAATFLVSVGGPILGICYGNKKHDRGF